MDQPNPDAATPARKEPRSAAAGSGPVFPSEARAVLSVLSGHLQHPAGAGDISKLRTSAAPDPDVYLLFFDDIYLGTITRLPGKTAGDADEFLHTPPVRE